MEIRNIAIIAHVDHGKTTLVDRILGATKVFRDNQDAGELIMDSNDLERERGITIFSKNAAVTYKDYKINVIDTPGHSDFGGEVERVLKMADGVILLVDAFEGPMPQTRFVLQKALQLNLHPIVVINKVDKPNCRPDEVHDAVFELFFNLDATEEQLNFPTFYGSGKNGWFNDSLTQTEDIFPLMDGIIKYVPAPKVNEGTLQLQITSLDYSSFLGRIAIGKVTRGSIKEGQQIALVQADGTFKKMKVKELYVFEGMGKRKVTEVLSGDLCAVVGLEEFNIGDTIADIENPEGLPIISVDEPTMSMTFSINNSPFFGRDGKFVTSRHLRDRLMKETEKNLALRVEDTDSADSFLVFGRGILHLGVLVETMRREGYELTVGNPQVLVKTIDGKKHEPYENLVVDVPSEYSGKVIDLVTQRKGEMQIMESKGEMQHLEFEIPSRGLIGLRSQMLTGTAGEAVMAHRFIDYKPWKGPIPGRSNGVLIAKFQGVTTAYSIDKLQDRGSFFVDPGDEVYVGQIIAEHIKPGDLNVNAVEMKKLTNHRASGSDDAVRIVPKLQFTLEECMEYIQQDECIEVTPKNIRMRKSILDENERSKVSKSMKSEAVG
ncbi:MAG TPA: translational GTPase TypA [Sediminibacterium sp.]|jgi:GTP-binding protein|uniref:translational GTPase TypA n=1 Tax=Sediminibacterium sp. TaxID=1917865 RepID=UPI0008AF1A03|nr:translational GTPase TypA [Sediminibacterium sp.]OHC86135.1 MAG: GTP-binding protein TypA [Sphingobacteriia bacterium RIFOXYC2_FULL_35_18]OHC89648.1 MAG: GTP-binding protein TypA [Sphingobacteriia bacterium RIFOXYD2_FULL_35_12]OYW80294.1 MAG: GTP-binding protein TypA [Sphingobacteriia bacterium 32-37-4]OYY09185.1 MAG: GTP-binding protein TypA [Sphingobacteriia bacterium 35-36-14]OYZ02322.1 MAG: GTP-binding protein TypA [Sphingobacteriia bacterium 28-36-52]OYZ52310.1 MAG: GTP-binding protei